ncbi:low choriolytic enzyme-like [Clarias gariepinus]|uniref:high choriolytic enzyme 1-like n=1 Tax=Clarias gariepinus TaxID=13013 RepID=UPI00234CCF08|nr:high choriolytic enzyme 1-like [Clarias gariepinus]
MHLVQDLLLLLLLSITLVQCCTTKEMVNETSKESDNNIDQDYFTVSAIIERANKNVGKLNRGFTIVDGDIAVNTGLQNADPCTSRKCKWPRGKNRKVYVPYVISRQYSPSEKCVIKRALNSFAKSTCIRFIRRTNEENYIHIISDSGCYSYIGRIGGKQVLSLERNGCVYFDTIQHELLHALGFNHEQTRSDRDKHVKILYENIKPGEEHNFKKINTNNLNTPYDYNSVMHYSRYAFSKNGKPTIVPIPCKNVSIGRATRMSANDILRVNRLYCR